MILERLSESDQSVLRRYPRLCPGTMICKALHAYRIRQGHQSLPQNKRAIDRRSSRRMKAVRKSIESLSLSLSLQLSLTLTIDVDIDNKVAKSD